MAKEERAQRSATQATAAARGAKGSRPPAGPSRSTLIERLVGRLPGPYGVNSLIVAAVLGSPGQLLAGYLTTGSLDRAIDAVFHGLRPAEPWLIPSLLLWWLQPFVTFWIVREMRIRVAAAEAELAPLLPDGRAPYRRLFPLSSVTPALLLAALVGLGFAGYFAAEIEIYAGSWAIVYPAVRVAVLCLAYGTAVWVYAATLWGLHRLGRQPLRLKPFYEDAGLGVRPMGSLSLSVSLAYLSFVAILALIMVIMPVVPAFRATLVVLTLLGVVLFFLPLLSVHRQMEREKERAAAALRRRWVQASGMAGGAALEPGPAAPADLAPVLADLRDLLALQAAERQIEAIRTWPFDVESVGGLAAAAIAVITGVLTDVITHALQG